MIKKMYLYPKLPGTVSARTINSRENPAPALSPALALSYEM